MLCRARRVLAGIVVVSMSMAAAGCAGPTRVCKGDLTVPSPPQCNAPAAELSLAPSTRPIVPQAGSSKVPGKPSVLSGSIRWAAIRAHQHPQGVSPETIRALGAPADAAGGGQPRPIEMLCLSGGGEYGAFGAGFLTGWSKAAAPHARPQFDVVTGVSTGSLISTFAFIGPSYDDRLERSYRDAATGTPVFKVRFLFGLLLADSVATRGGLEQRVNDLITPDLLRAVADSSDQGRRSLIVGTVNLDSGRMTFWSLSRIARIGVELERTKPGSLAAATSLYRTILLAATAIPGALPPVLIDRDRYRAFFEHDASCEPIVEPDWRAHAAIHCDGGARQNIFAVDLADELTGLHQVNGASPVNVYLIANGTLAEGLQVTQDSVVPIGMRAVNLLLSEAMRGNVATIALLGRQHGWKVRIAFCKLSDECTKLQNEQGSGLVDSFDGPFMECMMKLGEIRGASADDAVRWNSLTDLGLPE